MTLLFGTWLRINLNRSLLSLSSKRCLANSSAPFAFEINKFNDIHIKSNNVIKFSQETNFDPNVFESALKSMSIGN